MTDKKSLTVSEMGRLGAAVSNAKRTKEQRSKAAKKGWKKRKQALSEKQNG